MLNINSAIYSAQGIDKGSVVQVSNQILKEAQTQQNQPIVQGLDYSKFNRATLGVDLYSSRTNVELQKQIALTQAGLYAQAVNVAKLNSQAAANLYSAATVQKNVELAQSTTAQEFLNPPKIEKNSNIIQLFNISDKNANSSSGFNPFGTEEENAQEEKPNNNYNIFA